jgi:hypothetical protein
LRTHIQVLRGTHLDFQAVAEAEYAMQSDLRPGMSSKDIGVAVTKDANHAAQALADRVAEYYRRQGWTN